MKPVIEQPGLFSQPELLSHALGNASLTEFPRAFSREESAGYFTLLQHQVNWQSATLRIAGRVIPIPRLQCWVADPGLRYAYSGLDLTPEPWSEPLVAIRERVQQLTGLSFNAVLLNLYRDGNDSVAWHADDEPELGPDPVVASVSFGASRPFELRPKQPSATSGKKRVVLHDGSLLVMGKSLQQHWLHQLPKVKGLQEPRINLTFRQLVR